MKTVSCELPEVVMVTLLMLDDSFALSNENSSWNQSWTPWCTTGGDVTREACAMRSTARVKAGLMHSHFGCAKSLICTVEELFEFCTHWISNDVASSGRDINSRMNAADNWTAMSNNNGWSRTQRGRYFKGDEQGNSPQWIMIMEYYFFHFLEFLEFIVAG
jgi:hypothetical protein